VSVADTTKPCAQLQRCNSLFKHEVALKCPKMSQAATSRFFEHAPKGKSPLNWCLPLLRSFDYSQQNHLKSLLDMNFLPKHMSSLLASRSHAKLVQCGPTASLQRQRSSLKTPTIKKSAPTSTCHDHDFALRAQET
jgi:hypothetical protein